MTERPNDWAAVASWRAYADSLEARVKEQEEALRHIADWTYEPHNISVQEFARRALSADTEASNG